jgi:hypothetical protein
VASYKKLTPHSSRSCKNLSYKKKNKKGNSTEITYILWELKPSKGQKNE